MHRHTFAFLSLTVFGFASAVSAQAPPIGATCTVFPANNIWNTAVDQLPVAANSSTYVNTIGAATGVHPDFGAGTYDGGPIGIPFITVPGTQTKYLATFTYADESDAGPYAIPLTAPIEGGSASTGDRHAISVDTDNCILYELYAAYPQASSWQAGSGAIFSLASNALRPSGWTSADAAGLPIFPGLVRFDEIVAGEIRHALRFTVPQSQKAFVWPARHYASSLTGAQYPPMGARFRLRASFDISGYSPTNQIILKALKKYGMMIADNGSAWYLSGAPDSRWNNDDLHNLGGVHGSDFEVVDVSGLMVDPNSGQALQSSAVSVTVTPATASVQVNMTQQFNATVNNSTNQVVTWSVSASGGAITSGGLYMAPASVPSGTVTVTATSTTVPAVLGTATVTVTNPPPPPPPVSIAISPTSATVRVGRTRAFTATVQNTTDKAVIWKVNGVTGGSSTVGTISSLGTYLAPSKVPAGGTVTVSAVSHADSTKSASALVTISKR